MYVCLFVYECMDGCVNACMLYFQFVFAQKPQVKACKITLVVLMMDLGRDSREGIFSIYRVDCLLVASCGI